MSIAKAFYQCHILRFLSSHLVQLPYHRSLSYQSAYNRRHARPCLSSMYGCIRRGTVSVSIENYWQTERQSPPVMCGKLSWVPSKLTLQQAAKLLESLLCHFFSPHRSPMLMCIALWILEVRIMKPTPTYFYGFYLQIDSITFFPLVVMIK